MTAPTRTDRPQPGNPDESAKYRPKAWVVLIGTLIATVAFAAGTASMYGLHRVARAWSGADLAERGVTTWDRAATDNSYITVGPLAGGKAEYLIGRNGEVAHTWPLAHPLATAASMMDDGSLLYIGRAPQFDDGTAVPPGRGGAGGLLERISWTGETVWSYQDLNIHHDFSVLPDGTVAAIRWAQVPSPVARRIAGGASGTEAPGRVVWGDQIIEVDPKTNTSRVVFDVATQWSPEKHPIPEWETRAEWTHANSLMYLPSNPIDGSEAYLVSFRTTSSILIVSRASGQILWEYGGPWVLNQQHDASLLPDGHVLLFDNGAYPRARPSASRVLEIDPTTNKIVWEYDGYGLLGTGLYSSILGGAQRLSNGDTLITEGVSGRLLEVDTSGSIVWEYQHAFGPPDPSRPAVGLEYLFKSRAYPSRLVEELLRARPAG